MKIILFLALGAGLVLSVLSALGICSDACSEAASYSIFSVNLGWFGAAFFVMLLLAATVRNRLPWVEELGTLLVFAAAGAEARFIWLQKFVIGAWCPLCLGIAAAVSCAALMLLLEKFVALQGSQRKMKLIFKQMLLVTAAFACGLAISLAGVQKEAESAVIDPYLGKVESPVTVYFISDWFCPGCREVEPEIERMYPEVAKMARVAFIDYPIHPETANFTPYNLQFMAYEKAKYLKLRRTLAKLATKTKAPSPDQVQAAVAPLGVKMRQINYADVLYISQFNLTTYRGYSIKSTPSVVIVNTRSKRKKVLQGTTEITARAVKSAITELSK